MRSGGGKAKGASWEREVGRQLSLWLTDNERKDIFSRNVLSGGSFTITTAKGEKSSRMPGDLMAAHPLAFAFLARYLVECKHLASLGLEAFLYDGNGKTPLAQIISYSAGQAMQAHLFGYMIVAKQNHHEPLVITDGATGERLRASFRVKRGLQVHPVYHLMHRRHNFLMRFADMIKHVDPNKLLEQ